MHQGRFNGETDDFDLLSCGKKEIVLAGTYARTTPSLKERSKAARLRPAFTTAAPHGMTGMWRQLKKHAVPLAENHIPQETLLSVFMSFRFCRSSSSSGESDEEFPPVLKFMWDENVLDYLRFETLYYVMGDFLDALDQAFDAYKTEALIPFVR